MNSKSDALSWGEVGLFALGSLAGAILGILAFTRMEAAIAAQAPGFWFVSRAAAIVGYVLIWVSTATGVMLSSKGRGFFSGPLAFALHTLATWLGLGLGTLHALSLLGDRVVPFTVAGVLIPFAADYKPLLTALGSLSLYVGLLVSLSFYWKKQIGYRGWRMIHLLSYVMFVMLTAHGVALGTDSRTPAMQALYLFAGSSVLFLTAYRALIAVRGLAPTRAAGITR